MDTRCHLQGPHGHLYHVFRSCGLNLMCCDLSLHERSVPMPQTLHARGHMHHTVQHNFSDSCRRVPAAQNTCARL
jgi:hypothetical protein